VYCSSFCRTPRPVPHSALLSHSTTIGVYLYSPQSALLPDMYRRCSLVAPLVLLLLPISVVCNSLNRCALFRFFSSFIDIHLISYTPGLQLPLLRCSWYIICYLGSWCSVAIFCQVTGDGTQSRRLVFALRSLCCCFYDAD
jgi:hypothetical protein